MPNWVTTDIECHSGNIEELIEHVKGPHGAIDFNKVIPMPEDLNIESGTSGDMYRAWILSKQGTEYITEDNPTSGRLEYFLSLVCANSQHKNLSTLRKRVQADIDLNNGGYERGMVTGQRYIDNLNKYGHTDWYSWSIENWGTKWNCHEPNIHENILVMETAWGYPEPIIHKLMTDFNITADIHVLDEGYCFWGKLQYVEGELMDEAWSNISDLRKILKVIYGYDERSQYLDVTRFKRRSVLPVRSTWHVDNHNWWVMKDENDRPEC